MVPPSPTMLLLAMQISEAYTGLLSHLSLHAPHQPCELLQYLRLHTHSENKYKKCGMGEWPSASVAVFSTLTHTWHILSVCSMYLSMYLSISTWKKEVGSQGEGGERHTGMKGRREGNTLCIMYNPQDRDPPRSWQPLR